MQFYSLRVREGGGGGFSSSFLPSAPAMLLLCKALSGSLLFIHQLFLLWLTFVMCPVICLTFLEDAVSTNLLVLMSQLGRFMHLNTLIKGLHFSSYNSYLVSLKKNCATLLYQLENSCHDESPFIAVYFLHPCSGSKSGHHLRIQQF